MVLRVISDDLDMEDVIWTDECQCNSNLIVRQHNIRKRNHLG